MKLGGAQEMKMERSLADGATLDELLVAWDRLSAAVDRVVTALPAQMTDAAKELELARWEMRSVVNRYGFVTAALNPQSQP